MRAALLLLLLAWAPVAHAECSDPQSNAEMKLCTEAGWKAADAALNDAYGKAIAEARETDAFAKRQPGYKNTSGNEMLLRKSQGAWLAFRDANCNYHYHIYYGGSHAGLAYLICMRDMTEARLKELRMMPGGDEFE
jgi:uncharacterized protein YecT (DUF1311 family)